jgi:hypothetical protein
MRLLPWRRQKSINLSDDQITNQWPPTAVNDQAIPGEAGTVADQHQLGGQNHSPAYIGPPVHPGDGRTGDNSGPAYLGPPVQGAHTYNDGDKTQQPPAIIGGDQHGDQRQGPAYLGPPVHPGGDEHRIEAFGHGGHGSDHQVNREPTDPPFHPPRPIHVDVDDHDHEGLNPPAGQNTDHAGNGVPSSGGSSGQERGGGEHIDQPTRTQLSKDEGNTNWKERHQAAGAQGGSEPQQASLGGESIAISGVANPVDYPKPYGFKPWNQNESPDQVLGGLSPGPRENQQN